MSSQRTQPPRQYGAEEVQEILQRTSSLERKKQLERPTMELSEIEAIAKEAGLDPSLVRRAAQELEQKKGEHGLGSRLAGAPLRQVFEREVEGELTVASHEGLATELRAALGRSSVLGQVSAVGRTLTWSSISRSGKLEVHVFPRDGKTVIRVEADFSQLAGGLFGGLMGGLGGGLGANLAWMLPVTAHLPWYSGVAGFGAVLVGAWGLARGIYGAAVGSQGKKLEALVDTLELRVRESLTAAK
ncbi:MAG: hypothetical protein Q8L48_12440 [Archangium sp.]|nr:hypothetical protein [Archangium sp.]